MKNLVLIFCIAASAMAQRPSYAGLSAKGVPGLASRFRSDSTSGNALSGGIGSRNGGADDNISYDEYMANRYNEWPRENRPFSHTNAEVIRQHLGRPSSSNVNQVVPSSQNSPSNGLGNGATSGSSLGSNQNKPNQVLNSRFGGASSSPQTNNNSFSIVMNGQWRTYRYNEITDTWVRSQ